MVMLANLIDPWLTLGLVVIPFWSDIKQVLGTRVFRLYWLPFTACNLVLPVLAFLLNGYPARGIFATWNAILPICIMFVGIVGTFRGGAYQRTISNYFLLAILVQALLAMAQMAGSLGYMPGPLRVIYEWDLAVKVKFTGNNLIVGRSTGFYLNPNSLGVWGLLAFWISFFLLEGRKRTIGLVASFLTILLCQSRGTLFALLGSAATYGIALTYRRGDREDRKRILHLTGLLAAIAIVLIATPEIGDSLHGLLLDVPIIGRAYERYLSGAMVFTQGASADANFNGRVSFWYEIFKYISTHPFGTLGQPEYKLGIPMDNQFVSAFAQGNLYYLGALLLLLFGGARLIGSSLNTSKLLATASIAIAINGITAVPLSYPASYLYWAIVGVFLAEHVTRHSKEVHP